MSQLWGEQAGIEYNKSVVYLVISINFTLRQRF